MHALALAIAAIAAVIPAPALQAPQDPPAAAENAAALPADVLALTADSGSRMTVAVNVAGQGPYQFLVDTGAERTVISTELAGRLGLEPGRSVKVHSITEVSQVATRLIPHMEVSTNRIENVHAPIFPAADLGAAGMLGADSLKSKRVVFDFVKKTMAIWPSTKHQQVYGPDVIVVTGKSLYGRLVLVDARLDGEKIWVVVDTGSAVTIGNNVLRARLAQKGKLRATTPVEILSITGGKVTADYTQVRRISLGGIAINNMPIGFADVHPFQQLGLGDRPAILLGMDALRLFNQVSVDFAPQGSPPSRTGVRNPPIGFL